MECDQRPGLPPRSQSLRSTPPSSTPTIKSGEEAENGGASGRGLGCTTEACATATVSSGATIKQADQTAEQQVNYRILYYLYSAIEES